MSLQVSWHPKISPYRLSVISTTIGFGTAKILESQTGNPLIPTTLEWVAGTVLFLIIFSLSSYDSREEIPQHIFWLFKPDCMDILWRILSSLSITPPRYTTHERVTRNETPGVTLFRLLLSSIVLMFGITKAMLGYFGQATAMNWMDWLFAVPCTIIFYILGLYEYNSADIWPFFYITDRRDPFFYAIGQGSLITFYVSLTGLTLYGSIYSLQPLFNGTSETLFGPLGFGNDNETNPVRRYTNYVFARTLQLLLLAIIVVPAFSLIVSLFFISPTMRNVATLILNQFRKIIRWIRRAAFRLVGLSMDSIPIFFSNGSRWYFPEYHRVRPLFHHIVWHLCGLACCIVLSGFIAGLTMNTFDEVMLMLSSPTALSVPVGVLGACCSLFLVVHNVFLIGFVLYSLIFRYNK